jgi:hypothetical protein
MIERKCEMNDSYVIPTSVLDVLQDKIAKLNKRAARLNAEPITLTISEPRDVKIFINTESPLFDPRTDFLMREVVDVIVNGTAPKLNGWEFAATINHDEIETTHENANILRIVPGFEIEIPAIYRTSPDLCEHCNTNRRRNDTYIVYNAETNEFKQVGSTCLADFTGTNSPHKAAAFVEMMLDIQRMMNEFSETETGSHEYQFPIEHFLACVAYTIRNEGWLSRSKARELNGYGAFKIATADVVINALTSKYESERIHPEPADVELAENALTWVRENWTPDADLNDYQWNMYIVCNKFTIRYREAGYVASAINAYNRAMEKQVERARAMQNKANQFLGEVGMKKFTVTATLTRTHEFAGTFGMTNILTFETTEGNTIVWFCTASVEIELGAAYEIIGTIKAHETFNGTNQTIVSRAKIKKLEIA